jgi:hypothetical protein
MHCYFPKRRSAPLFATEHKDETHERGPTETQFQQAQFYFPMLNCQTNHNAFHQNSCSVYWKLVARFNRTTERKIEGPMEISNCAHYHFLPSLFSDLSALFRFSSSRRCTNISLRLTLVTAYTCVGEKVIRLYV